ncbi:Nuclear transport factor 2 [Nowakowskiella sp. JEL0078]|nr:Nuclear transport factor 2 [Nowakowskiella sp. JEL0078]
MDISTISKEFTNYYYGVFKTNRAQLAPLYRDISMMTFENEQMLGAEKIVAKLTNLPFKQVTPEILTVDAQPSNPNIQNAMIVSVTGKLTVRKLVIPSSKLIAGVSIDT